MQREAPMSSADTLRDTDRLVDVKVVLYLRVNRDAYDREYGGKVSVSDLKWGIRHQVFDMVEEQHGAMPEGILLDLIMD